MNKYMYNCYDKDKKSLGIFFEEGTKELLEHHPNVKYVKGMDAVTSAQFGTKWKKTVCFLANQKIKIMLDNV